MDDNWTTVAPQKKVSSAGSRKKPTNTNPRVISNVPSAKVTVAAVTQAKPLASKNKQVIAPLNSLKLDNETEELKHDKLPLCVGRAIMQARQAKGLSQKDLAGKIFEKQQLIAEYEAGGAIPNHNILNKLERQLEVKLRGKDIGKKLDQPNVKKSVPNLNQASTSKNGAGKKKQK